MSGVVQGSLKGWKEREEKGRLDWISRPDKPVLAVWSGAFGNWGCQVLRNGRRRAVVFVVVVVVVIVVGTVQGRGHCKGGSFLRG